MNDLFLSLLTIKLRDRLKARLTDEYAIHQLVYRMFPYEASRQFLYRLDYDTLGTLSITIQSSVKPEDIGIGRLEIKRVPVVFLHQEKYYFRVRFSPIAKSNGKVIRVNSRTDSAIRWLVSRSDRFGVEFDESSMDKELSSIMNMHGKNGNVITISSVDISGILMVKDKMKFAETVYHGIGPYKGFGLGLMQLKPIKEESQK